MKKIISICLITVCMLLSVGLAFAEETVTDRQKEAISLLNDLNIFSDISEESLQEEITRAEFAKIVVRVMGEDNLTVNPRRIYTDVLPDNDAAASIELLYDRGIMVGYSGAEFRPDENITLEEVAKVIVTMMGYSDRAELSGGYPNGYYTVAMNNRLVSGVTSGRTERITFADMAMVVQNILGSKNYMVISGYDGNGHPIMKQGTDKDYMGYVFDIYKYTGVLEAYGDISLYDLDGGLKEDVCKIGGEIFDKGDMDVSQYLGMRVKAYYKSDDNDGYYIMNLSLDDNNSVTEVNAEDIIENTTTSVFQYYDNTRTKKININDNAVYIYNGKKLDIVSDDDVIPENGFVRLISNDGDNKIDVVIIKNYETLIVDKAVVTDKVLHFKYEMGSLDLGDNSRIKVKYYMEGEETDFSSISSGSVLSVALSKNLVGDMMAEIYISNKKVTGMVKSINNSGPDRSVTMEDGTEYKYTKDFMNRLDENQANTYAPSFDNEGVFYIDYFDKLAAYTLVTSGKNYAYVVKCYYDSIVEEGSIRLFTKDAEFKNLDITDKTKYNGAKVNRADIPELLKKTGESNTIHQLIIYTESENGSINNIQTAENKIDETYYVADQNEFILNSHPKNDAGEPCGVRFYKNMAENRPYSFVDGQTIQFLIPNDKKEEKHYKIATKLSSTDVALPAPVYIYDAGAAGNIGAVTTNTASEGKYSTPGIVDKMFQAIDEDGLVCTGIQFVGGTSVLAGSDIIYDQPAKSDSKGTINWRSRIDYTNVTINDLKRGDVIQYTTAGDKVEMLRVIVKVDNIGPVRIDGDNMQLNGNMIADVISVSENGRTAMVYYVDRFGTERYQTMLVNGTVYRYDSNDNQVYNSSTADITAGDRVLINSYWWSPKVVVIFR